jgi:hypothetical protein
MQCGDYCVWLIGVSVPASSVSLLGSEVQHRSKDSTAVSRCSHGCRGKIILRGELCEVGNTSLIIGQWRRGWAAASLVQWLSAWLGVAALFLDLNPRWGRVADRPMHVVSTAGALIGHLLKPTTISRNQGDQFVSEIGSTGQRADQALPLWIRPRSEERTCQHTMSGRDTDCWVPACGKF